MQNDAKLWARVGQEQLKTIRAFTVQRPVPVAAMGNALGLEIKSVTLEPNISGEIRPSPSAKAGYKIRVNRHEKKARQRFTVAHEIAHYLLHSDRIGDGIADSVLYRSGLSNEVEWEANRLAADLLMPRDAVKDALARLGGVATLEVADQLADIFEVSLPAMKIRLGIE